MTSLRVELSIFIRKSRLAILLLTILLSSCQTYLNYAVNVPPKIQVEVGSQFLFFNRFDYDLAKEGANGRTNVHQQGISQLKTSLKSAFDKDLAFSIIVLDSTERGNAPDRFEHDLFPASVRKLFDTHHTDYLITLDYFNPYYEMAKEISENEDGSTSASNNTDLILECGFSLYDIQGRLVDQGFFTEMKDFRDRPALTKWLLVAPSISKAGDEINELSFLIGRKYVDLFYPGIENRTGLYYIGKDFKKITPLMKSYQWEKAEVLLLELIEKGNPKIAPRAEYNLRLVHDAMGKNKY